jgi:hypothetical protein
MELTQSQQDFAYAEGFLISWLKDSPVQIREHLKTLSDGISFYREKLDQSREDYRSLLDKYNQLMGLSSQYLELMKQQKDIIDQNLIDSQREFHGDKDVLGGS